MSIQQISPLDAQAMLASQKAVLVDIREADEYARAHVPGSRSDPAGTSFASARPLADGPQPIFMCRSGARTSLHCERLASGLGVPAMMLAGGLDAWGQAGLPVAVDRSAPLEMMRQVQMAAGLLILSGFALAWLVHPGFLMVSAFVGVGLTFAGLTGFCGMARLLAVMPWNRSMAG